MTVELEPLGGRHAERLFALLWGSRVLETILWDGPSSLDEFRSSLLARENDDETKDHHRFAIVADGAPVGSIDLRPVAGDFRSAMGLWVGIPHQGRGIATQAIGMLLERAFTQLKRAKVEASIFVGNSASRRAFENNGFQLEGTIRKAARKQARLVDEWLLGITQEDYAEGVPR